MALGTCVKPENDTMILFDAEVTICIYKWLIISVNIFLLDGYYISYLELYACILLPNSIKCEF